MSLLEAEMTPIIKKIMDSGPVETEKFIRKLVYIVGRQSGTICQLRWSDEAREIGLKAEKELEDWMLSLKG